MTNLQTETAISFSAYAGFLIFREGVYAIIDALTGRLPKEGVQGAKTS